MNVIVRSQAVPVSSALAEHCRARVYRAMQPFAGRVERVEVVLVDLNGPKKGLGQACRVFVALRRGGSILFGTSARDHYLAATRAASGARRHVARVLARSRSDRATPSPPDAA